MESYPLVHGAYYWLRVNQDIPDWGMKSGSLYIGQFVEGTWPVGFRGWFDICGTDNPPDMEYFDILEMIEYKGNK